MLNQKAPPFHTLGLYLKAHERKMFNGLFDIVFFAFLAAFLAFRLYSVLGRKDENDSSPERLSKYLNGKKKPKGVSGNVVTLPVGIRSTANPVIVVEEPAFSDSVPDNLKPVLEAIHSADKNFTEKQFIKGAQAAFDIILSAFAKGDKSTLEPLLSKELYKDFVQDIDERKKAGEQLDVTVVAILSSDIVDATLQKGVASVTVKFSSEQISIVRDKEGAIISGNPSHIDVIDDSWTFSRNITASNPNWKLVLTNQLE